MDLRSTKRKRSDHEENDEDMDIRSFSKDRSLISASDEDSYHSCVSNNHSFSTTNQLSESIIEPQAFLEGTESRDYISITLDSINPVIMPQEVVVYGYENASFNKKATKSVFPLSLNNNMSKLHISPQKTIAYPVSSNTEYLSTHDYEIPKNSLSHSGDKLLTSLNNDFLDFRRNTNHIQINQLPPCTQTSRHKIDEISKYVLTPNFRPGYISNLQFNMTSITRGYGTISSILPEEQPQFSFEKPNSPQIAPTTPNVDHQLSHSEQDISQVSKGQFVCTICTITFGAVSDYLTHLRAHINISTLICEICLEQLPDASDIRDHIARHAQMEAFLCEYCSMTFVSLRYLSYHLLNRVKGVIFPCLSCPMKFCCKRGLIQHKRIHDSTHLLCNECPFKSLRLSLIHNHLRSVHDIKNASAGNHFQMHIPRSLKTKYKLLNSKVVRANQLQKHHPNSRKNRFHVAKIECQHCSKEFKTQCSLNQHIIHRKCQKETAINSLPIETNKMHGNMHDSSKDTDMSGEMSKNCVCPYCSDVFKRVAYLNQHIRKRVCQKNVPSNSSTIEIEDVNDEYPHSSIDFEDNDVIQNDHVCTSCHGIFKNQKSLRQHTRKRVCLKNLPSNSLTNAIGDVDDNLRTSSIDLDDNDVIQNLHVCTNCHGIFKNQRSVQRHTRKRICLKNLPSNSLTSGMENGNVHTSSMDLNDNDANQNAPMCTNCHRIFKKKVYLNQHLRYGVCLRNLPSNSLTNAIGDVDVHTSLDLDDNDIQNHHVCTNCDKIFERKEYLRQHIRNRVCLKNVPSNSLTNAIGDVDDNLHTSSIDIEDNDTIQKHHVCTNCLGIFKNQKSLRQHIRNHICIKIMPPNPLTSDMESVNVHTPIDLDDNEVINDLMCTNCHRIFKKKVYLNQHIRNRICQKDSSSNSVSISKDKITYGVNNSKKLICPYCDKEFKSRSNCKLHITYLKCQKRKPSNSLHAELDDINTELHSSLSDSDSNDDIENTELYQYSGRSFEEYSLACNNQLPTNSMPIETDEVTSDLHSSSDSESSDDTPENFVCEHCNLAFESVACLREHIRYCIIQKNLPSNSLQIEGNDVSEHSSSIVSDKSDLNRVCLKKHACPHCARKFQSRRDCNLHVTNHKCQKKSYNTDVVIEYNDLDLDHTKDSPKETSHEEWDENACPRCTRVFTSRKYLIRHYNYTSCELLSDLENTGIKKKQICPHCQMVFTWRKSMLYHIGHSCAQFSPRKSPFLPNIKKIMHSKIMHSTDSSYTCDNCTESFMFISTLQDHVRNRVCASNSSQINSSLLKYKTKLKDCLPYTCKHCQITLSSNRALLRHNYKRQCSHTTESNPLKATKKINLTKSSNMNTNCANKAKPNSQIENFKSEGPKLITDTQHFNCLYCKEKFLDRNIFKNHIQMSTCITKSLLYHEGENICSGCKGRFNTPANIRRHVLKNSCKFFNESYSTPE